MMAIGKYMVVITFIWVGFILGISFMEAPLKFRVPLVDLRIGLSIGRIIFNTLNKIEVVFSLALIVFWVYHHHNLRINAIIAIVLVIVSVQTFYLLPILDARALAHIQQKLIAPSRIHLYYISTEVIKLVSLFILGFWQLNLWKAT